MIRIAMLGAGRIGKIHARNVAANPRCRLVAVADPIAEFARSLAESLGADSSTDAAATLARPDVDAVVIGTPTDTHVDLMLAAARGGKAVLCEKPVDLDIRGPMPRRRRSPSSAPRSWSPSTAASIPASPPCKRAIDAGEVGRRPQVVITSRDPAPAAARLYRAPAASSAT